MKKQNVKMWAAAVLVTLFVLGGCAEKDDMDIDMAMDEMKKETMTAEMKTDSGMKTMDSKMDDMSNNKMATEMDESMKGDMHKME